MRLFNETDLVSKLEEGFKLVPLQPAAQTALPTLGLTISVVVRGAADPAAGHFVLLRDGPLARVFLGCTADSNGQPQEWLELWVQNVSRPTGADPAFGGHSTNALRDARWRDLAEALRRSEPGSVLATPLEKGHLPPAILNLAEGRFIALTDPEAGQPLEICADDRRLEDAGLPGYATSAHRYLSAAGGDPAQARFIRLTPDAPAGSRTTDLRDVLPDAASASTLGLDGPAVIVRRFAPLSLEEFSEATGGRAWKGVDNARKIFHVPGVYRLLEDEDEMRCGSAHLFTGAQGRSGRLGEALYLKLQAVRQAFALVRNHVQQNQLPFLNLAADSFRVRLGATGFGLPFLWTAQTSLVRPGAAFALPLRNTATRYFQGLEPLTASVYRPGFVGMAREGTADVRIRKGVPADRRRESPSRARSVARNGFPTMRTTCFPSICR